MNILESLRVALRGLAANKMRSILTMLGIIIGVAAVIALMSMGEGVSASITQQIQGIGSNLVIISPGSTLQGGARTAQGSAVTLTYEDAEALTDPQSRLPSSACRPSSVPLDRWSTATRTSTCASPV